MMKVRAYTQADVDGMVRIWNQVVEDGVAFPQEELLTPETGKMGSPYRRTAGIRLPDGSQAPRLPGAAV